VKAVSLLQRAPTALVAVGLSLSLHAQGIVSSGMTGVVQDPGGKPVAGTAASATAVPTPNNELSRWRILFGARLKF
jgi:hypothetical protein